MRTHTPTDQRHSRGGRECQGWIVLIGAVLLTTMALPDGAGSVQSPILNVPIMLENWSPYYQPPVATVAANTPIEWFNPTPSPHSIRHDGCQNGDQSCLFDSGAVQPDRTYILPGLPPGRYPYHCELHPIMRGVLIVVNQTEQTPSQTGALR